MYKDYSYHILSAKDAFHSEELSLRNSIYSSWHKLWTDVYSQSDAGYHLSSDEFIRQDLVTAILHKEKVAAIHLYSFFHLDASADLSTKYFHFFSEKYLQELRQKKVKTVMSMEFLTVLPEFRKSNIGFSIGSTIIQLGTQVFGQVNADAIVAPARNDVGVNKMAYDLGFSCIEKETEQRGFTCDLIACFQGHQRRSENLAIRSCADHLWNTKMVYPSVERFITPVHPRSMDQAA
ncbi:MAG: hypothetical protein COT73_09225 [Bdellovibrio sp. CG10_big_fil_rev_8_21_14_0_10_47_8]|nr:MAG: hypothetical protein COT73_09225 [Bdellovibrio sp. CG10_big_fil_rev_8_21_14_0_10_47_8]